jgi:hypothetical protein
MRRMTNKNCEDCGGTGEVFVKSEPTPLGPRLILGACHCVRWILDPLDLRAMIELGEET